MKQMKKSKYDMLVIFFNVLILLCVGFGTALAAENPKRGGTISLGTNVDIGTLDPYQEGSGVTAQFMYHILEPLVVYGDKLEILPLVAEKWEISKDLKTYTFHLRKGKLFHNGRELVADDVKYSIERMASKKSIRSKMFHIASVDVVDKYTVRVNLTQPDAQFLSVLAQPSPCLGILPRAETEAQGEQITNPIGTGPFKFVEWKPDRYALVERFDQYVPDPGPPNGFGGKKVAYVDKAKFIPTPEESVAVMALLNKEIDVLHVYPFKYYAKYEKSYKKKGIVVLRDNGLVLLTTWLGCADGFTKNVKFRQALAYAIDLGAVTTATSNGFGTASPSYVSVNSKYWTPYHKTWYKKDLNKAKKLLKEAGYNGEQVVISATKKFGGEMYREAVALHSEITEAGINAKLEVLEWPVILQKFYKGDYQILAFGHAPKPEPIGHYLFTENNSFNKQYPRMREIFSEMNSTVDIAKLSKLYEEAHKLMYEGVPAIKFYHKPYMQGHGDQVKGFKIFAVHPRLWNVWLDK